MELTVRVQALVAELQLAEGIVEREQENRDLVHLEARDDALTITARGHSLWLQNACSAKVSSPGTIAVPVRRLLGYVQLLPRDADLKIQATESDRVNLSVVRAETLIPGISGTVLDTSLPSEPSALGESPGVAEPKTRIPVDVLLTALERTIISVADEESHYTIEGALFVVQHDKVGMVSTDGHRLSLYFRQAALENMAEESQGLMSRKAMATLKKILERAEGTDEQPASVEFALSSTQMYFRSGSRLFVCQKLAGKFPDYNRVMPKDFTVLLELDKDVLAPVLRRVSLFSERRSHGVRFDIENGTVRMQAQVVGDDPDLGTSEESIAVDYDGDPLSVGFNAKYLLEFLSICTSQTFHMRLSDPRSAVLLEIPDLEAGTDYRYVVMPIRV